MLKYIPRELTRLRHDQGGYLLIELMLVLVIFGIMVLGALGHFDNQVQEANISAAYEDMQTIRTALQLYDFLVGTPPVDYAALVSTFTDSKGKSHGALVSKPGWTTDGSTWKDPWKQQSYGWTGAVGGTVGGAGYSARMIVCAGPDKTFGTADDIVLGY